MKRGPKVSKEKTEKLFWDKVDKTPGLGPKGTCWEWTAGKNNGGYGHFAESVFSGKRKIWKAHRFSYFLERGSIPDGMLICHTCDNRSCCNPDHLWAGSAKDNSDDMFSKGRRNGWLKVTDDQALHIRQEYDDLPLSKSGKKKRGEVSRLANQYGVTNSLIVQIGKRRLRRIND